MSFALILIGVIMVVAAVRNTQHCLVLLIKSEFEGPGNFTYWVAAIIIIGIIGMSETTKPLSQGLLALILVALFLAKGTGVFAQLKNSLASTGEGGTSSVSINLPQIGLGSFTGG
jgi:hypothetical protein